MAESQPNHVGVGTGRPAQAAKFAGWAELLAVRLREARSRRRGVRMRLYHRTASLNAAAILAEGFRDAEGAYMTTCWHRGVWVSDRPLDINEGAGTGASDDVLLVLEVPESVVAEHEWIEEGKPYREFLVPAQTLNGYPLAIDHEEES